MTDQPSGPDQYESVAMARPVAYARAVRPLNDLELPGIRRRDALLGAVLVVVATIVIPYAPALFGRVDLGAVDPRELGRMLIRDKWVQAVLAVLLMTFLVLHHRLRIASFGLRFQRPGRQAAWGLAALVGLYVALLVGTLIVTCIFLITPTATQEIEQRLEFMNAMPISSVGMQLVLLVAVAIEEEFVFRGMLLPYLRRLLGSWWAAGLVSSLLFALLHVPGQGVLAGLQVFFIAAALTTFFILSRSLLAVMIAHFMFDFLQFQLIRLLPDPHKMMDALGQ